MVELGVQRVIGIDIGTSCGYAYSQGDKIHPALSGVWNLAPGPSIRLEGGGMRFVRFRKLMIELLADVDNHAIVFFEEVKRHGGKKSGPAQQTKSAQVFGGFMYTLAALCEERGVPYEGLGVGQIKKHATGKGNSNKEVMMEAARQKWGVNGEGGSEWKPEEDQADALWVLDCGLAQLGL